MPPAKAIPPPLPTPPTRFESNPTILVDLPYTYLLERSHWTDFRKALNNCALTWNIPDWMCTILYRGPDYNQLLAKDKELDEIFRLPTIQVGDEKVEVGSKKSRDLIKMLGFPKNIGEYIQVSTKYCNLSKLEFEADSKLPARQKLWSWMVKCLFGTKMTPGPYYYLVNQIRIYDVSALFKRLIDVIETVTICSLDDEVYNVTHLDFDPSVHDLFGYLEELRKATKRLSDLNERLPEEGRVLLSEAYLRSRLVRAARQIPTYKSVIDHLVIQPIEVWSVMTLEELCKKLESAQANDLSLVPKRTNFQTNLPLVDDQVKANFATSKNKHEKKTTKTCHEFDRTGACKRGNSCHFVHQQAAKPKPEQKSDEKFSSRQNNSHSSTSAPPSVPARPCGNCGEVHGKGQCKKKEKCTWCTKEGHKEEKCFSKKAGKPQILFSSVADDGVIVLANLLICEENEEKNALIEAQLSTFKLKTLPEAYVKHADDKIMSNVFVVEEKNTCALNAAISEGGGPPPPYHLKVMLLKECGPIRVQIALFILVLRLLRNIFLTQSIYLPLLARNL